MTKLIKRLSVLIYEVNRRYYLENDTDRKQELKVQFKRLSDQLVQAFQLQLDENDVIYQEIVKDIKIIYKQLAKLDEALSKTDTIFRSLSDIISKIDRLLTDAKIFE